MIWDQPVPATVLCEYTVVGSVAVVVVGEFDAGSVEFNKIVDVPAVETDITGPGELAGGAELFGVTVVDNVDHEVLYVDPTILVDVAVTDVVNTTVENCAQ